MAWWSQASQEQSHHRRDVGQAGGQEGKGISHIIFFSLNLKSPQPFFLSFVLTQYLSICLLFLYLCIYLFMDFYLCLPLSLNLSIFSFSQTLHLYLSLYLPLNFYSSLNNNVILILSLEYQLICLVFVYNHFKLV